MPGYAIGTISMPGQREAGHLRFTVSLLLRRDARSSAENGLHPKRYGNVPAVCVEPRVIEH